MPKAKNKSPGTEEDSEWEKVSHRRHQGHQDGRQSRSPPKSGKTKPDGKGSTPTRSDSLGGKRARSTDSEPDGKVDPKRTPGTPISTPNSQHSTPSTKPDNSASRSQKIPKISNDTNKPAQTNQTSQSPTPTTSWAEDEPEVSRSNNSRQNSERSFAESKTTSTEANKTSYAQAAKGNPTFKKPLPIPDWKELELRIYKTTYSQVPISHKEFNSIRTKMYDHIFHYLKANRNPASTHNTEASHNQWSAALQCGIWECDNKEALNWHKEAISTITNNEFRAWARNEKSTQLIKIFPHDSFAHYSALQFLESIQFYHQDLHINRWKVLHEYRQLKGNRVLVIEIPTQDLDQAKRKALHSESGQWRLRGMAMPMRFAMATPSDLQRASPAQDQTNSSPEVRPDTSALSSTPTRPSTPRTPTTNPEKRVGFSNPVVSQPGSTTPLSSAMSGFSLASPLRPTFTPTIPQAPQLPLQGQGDYYAVYDPQTQTYTPIGTPTYAPQPFYPQPYNQPYPIMQHPFPYQTPPQTYQPTPSTIPAQQPVLQPTQQTPPPLTLPQGENVLPFSQEEMEEALQGGEGEYSDSDSELLKDDPEEESNNKANKHTSSAMDVAAATNANATNMQ